MTEFRLKRMKNQDTFEMFKGAGKMTKANQSFGGNATCDQKLHANIFESGKDKHKQSFSFSVLFFLNFLRPNFFPLL